MVVGRSFLFCVEVIAHGKQTAPALPASWVTGAGPGRLVPKAQAKAGAPKGVRRLARLVQPAGMDGRPAPRPAVSGAVLPGVRPAGPANLGHRRGPHPGPQGRLGGVYRPGQPAKPVPLLPLPQNHGGAVAKTAQSCTLIFAGSYVRAFACGPAYAAVRGCTGAGSPFGARPSPPPQKVLRVGVEDPVAPRL